MHVPASIKPDPHLFTLGMLKRKAAVVTGSTSGLGHGSAEALDAQSADVLLNGLGDQAGTERVRTSQTDSRRVRVFYSVTDISTPDEINVTSARATRDLGSLAASGAVVMPSLGEAL